MTWIITSLAILVLWGAVWVVIKYPWYILQLTVATALGGYSCTHQWFGGDGHRPAAPDYWLGLAAALAVTAALSWVIDRCRHGRRRSVRKPVGAFVARALSNGRPIQKPVSTVPWRG